MNTEVKSMEITLKSPRRACHKL